MTEQRNRSGRGRQFLSPLARQLARFDVELTTDTEDKNFALQSLRNWVQMNVDNHRKQLLPTFLVPVAVSESY